MFFPLKHHIEWSVGNSDKPLFSYKVYLTISFISFAKISPYKKNEVINIFSIFVA